MDALFFHYEDNCGMEMGGGVTEECGVSGSVIKEEIGKGEKSLWHRAYLRKFSR